MPAWTRLDDGIRIAVRVTPRASRDAIAGGDDWFQVRLRAPPVEGAANEALVYFLAKAFDLAKRDVTLIAGETARLKRLHLKGDPQRLESCALRLYSAVP
ncbi:DUF167 domain-containing protein [Sphingobium boeckii]|uniref:UPF0235 protein FHS49_000111 n=1 Tax=Sphingobium boeckii TaxID=1082345 RepID=A0A7W9AEH4_9SPHN|nr:DUF167 domain-containing protein [Sphingobium boeckii]MBB5684120.1 hypothetical protein [Sphingobium boeckii]